MNSGEFLVTGPGGLGSAVIKLNDAKFDGVEFLDNEVSIEQEKARFDGREVTVVFEGVTDADNQYGQMPRAHCILDTHKRIGEKLEKMAKRGRVIPGYIHKNLDYNRAIKAVPQSECLSKMVPHDNHPPRPLASLVADYYLQSACVKELAVLARQLVVLARELAVLARQDEAISVKKLIMELKDLELRMNPKIKEAAEFPILPGHENVPEDIRTDLQNIDGVCGYGKIYEIPTVHIKPKNDTDKDEICEKIKKVFDERGWKKEYKVVTCEGAGVIKYEQQAEI